MLEDMRKAGDSAAAAQRAADEATIIFYKTIVGKDCC